MCVSNNVLVTWIHEFLFNESSNFFNEFFWYVFLGGRTFDCNRNTKAKLF